MGSPAPELWERSNEGCDDLLNQDPEALIEDNVSEADKEDSLDDIMAYRNDCYGPPIDPPYGQAAEESEFTYRSAKDEEPAPDDDLHYLTQQRRSSGFGTLEDFSRTPCAMEASSRVQAFNKDVDISKPKKPKQARRRDAHSNSKPSCRSKSPAVSAFGTVVAPVHKRPHPTQPDTLSQCPPTSFQSGCKYRIGQMNPILLPLPFHKPKPKPIPSPSFHPMEEKVEEEKEQEQEMKCREAAEKVIGTLTRKERKEKVRRYIEKRKKRIWEKKVNYACRKRVAERRLRIQGKFVARDAAAALLGAEATDLSRNGLVQSLLQTNAHCSIISSANNLKIRNVQSLFEAASTRESPPASAQLLKVPSDKTPCYKVVPGTSGNKIAIHTLDAGVLPSSLPSPFARSSLPESRKFSHIVDLPFVADPVFVCKRKKLEETPASHLKHHKN